jgi:hypothetical protein
MTRYRTRIDNSIFLLLRTDAKINFELAAYFPSSISLRDGVIEVDVTSSAMLDKRLLYPESSGVSMYLTCRIFPSGNTSTPFTALRPLFSSLEYKQHKSPH